MTDKIENPGLCMNCTNHPDCYYENNHGKPILFCEEFQCIAACNPYNEPVKNDGKINTSESLCNNCDLRQSCSLHKGDSPVIFCEEYI